MATNPSYEELLTRIINDGITAAKRDYTKPADKARLEGSIAGFEACRGKNPQHLASLLSGARQTATGLAYKIMDGGHRTDEYWRARCFELEVEFVANVVSAAFLNAGKPVIVPPTARGIIKAAEILGTRTPTRSA